MIEHRIVQKHLSRTKIQYVKELIISQRRPDVSGRFYDIFKKTGVLILRFCDTFHVLSMYFQSTCRVLCGAFVPPSPWLRRPKVGLVALFFFVSNSLAFSYGGRNIFLFVFICARNEYQIFQITKNQLFTVVF